MILAIKEIAIKPKKNSRLWTGFELVTFTLPGGGGIPYNGLYGEAPPERGTFFRLQVYKRVGIS